MLESIRSKVDNRNVVDEPRVVKWLLTSPVAAWVWLVPRLWLGWRWLEAGEQKLLDPAWMVSGSALRNQWQSLVSVSNQDPSAISFDWYRILIRSLVEADAQRWLGPITAWSEILVGVALVLGAFTGIAAFFGTLIHWDHMVVGSVTSNPMVFVVAVCLMFAWRVAGYVGMDYFLLPLIGPSRSHPATEEASASPPPGAYTFWSSSVDDR